MKSILKYISLLIFSGLIIPFCYQFRGVDNCANHNISLFSPGRNKQPITFRIIKELAKNLTPILKSENNL
jgi:hypothetical protein